MRLCRSHIMYIHRNTCVDTHIYACTHTHIHTWMHPPSHACMHTRRHLVGSETQTYTKLLKQTQIPHYRFGFGTWYSKFLKNLKWFVDIAADRQRRCTGQTCFTVQHFEFDAINVTAIQGACFKLPWGQVKERNTHPQAIWLVPFFSPERMLNIY